MKIHTLNGNGTALEGAEERISLITGKPIRKAKFFETMTTIHDPTTKARLRVWREAKEMPDEPDIEVIAIFQALPDNASLNDIIDAIGSIEGVNAVELVDERGLGGVAYYEWP